MFASPSFDFWLSEVWPTSSTRDPRLELALLVREGLLAPTSLSEAFECFGGRGERVRETLRTDARGERFLEGEPSSRLEGSGERFLRDAGDLLR